ncbi:MAG: ThuA domain-containing protein [Verrucomicrobiota bacterium]
MKTNIKIAVLALTGLFSIPTLSAEEVKPLKALLLTGGCCHDYKAQKDILKNGIEARGNIVVTQIHTDSTTVTPDLPIYGMPEYAAGYDIVIHDECAAGISDDKVVKGVLAPHDKGTPAVNLHCAMHSYRIGEFKKPIEEKGTPTSQWFEFLGIQSTSHGPKKPLEIVYTDKKHPITQGLADWTTGDEELYNNVKIFDSAHALAKGTQKGKDAVVTWTNDYKGTRVFNTTIGHFNETVSDARYLDLVTRGLLWACGKMDDTGKITAGYEPKVEKK